MPEYKLIIFDLDGTLIDSLADYAEAANRLLDEHGLPPITREDVRRHMGLGLRKFVTDLFPETHHSQKELNRISEKFNKYYSQVCVESTQFYDGVLEFLDKWTEYSAIVTNKNEEHAVRIIEHLLPDHPFSSIFGANTFDNKKPHPEPLVQACSRVNVPPQHSLMVGDGEPDIKAAKALNMHSVAVTYGNTDAEELAPLDPTYMIDEFAKLHDIAVKK